MKTSQVILLVDDVPIYNKMLELLIKRNLRSAYQIFKANNGKEAVDFCKSNQVDLIFMNIEMPVMDGFEATKIIKKRYPEVSIIAHSAYLLKIIKQRYKEANFDAFIEIPIREEKIRRIVEQFL